jgi:hypothetical protein
MGAVALLPPTTYAMTLISLQPTKMKQSTHLIKIFLVKHLVVWNPAVGAINARVL